MESMDLFIGDPGSCPSHGNFSVSLMQLGKEAMRRGNRAVLCLVVYAALIGHVVGFLPL